jgi:3-phenylpropionate/trans-cinnamate dioxygenase ferredoxin subunit
MVKCSVAALADITVESVTRVEVHGVPICLARLANGQVFAIGDRCSHEDIELSGGDLDGDDVECPSHGSRFNVKTGEVSGLPAEEPVATYEVSIENGEIFVSV